MMPMFWVRWIEHPLVRSDAGIVRVKMMPKRLKALSGVVRGGWWVLFMCMQTSVIKLRISTLSVFYLSSYEFAPSGESLLLCDNGQLHIHIPLIVERFWKNSSYVSGLSVCIFVALWLCVFGCALQGSIRLKILWVDARSQWYFGI